MQKKGVTDENREQILDSYAEYILDGVSFNDLWILAYNHIRENKDTMMNKDLENEILNYYPEILGE